ncbi:hypothetical protein BOTNAR_0578g00030 [Botryotinia narcissicola]|uniref:Uncharacterized protein n=1 Tax=Botryotinia narcissicola TaxID=278944 RepID=A0A4Z1HNL1_9HELO|nr:hypothetical protein BOTNAR_0578g00030 [Botryotinia narcissicola]
MLLSSLSVPLQLPRPDLQPQLEPQLKPQPQPQLPKYSNMSLPEESLTSQSSTPKIFMSPSFHSSPQIFLSKEAQTKRCSSPKSPPQAHLKTESPCRSIIQTTHSSPATPGLDVWVSGISHRKTLQMLGYPSSKSHMSFLTSTSPSFPNTTTPTSKIQKSQANTRSQIPASSVLNYLLETSPKKMHITINGCKRTSQVEDKSEDYAILQYIAHCSEPRYWVFDIEDLHCAVCCKQMRDQRRRDYEKSRRWSERVKGAWRQQHCVNSWCHGPCTHERRVGYCSSEFDELRVERGMLMKIVFQSHHVLARLGRVTTRKIKYVQLTTSSERMDPDILASAITVLKPFVSKLSGLEILLVSSSDVVGRARDMRNGSRQEARRFICCFMELEEWLVEGARLEIKGLGNFGELEDMWWDVRRKWWRMEGRVKSEK